MQLITTASMIAEVRNGLGEQNLTALTDDDIVGFLNKAQSTGLDILCKSYDFPLLKYKLITPSSGQDIDIPSDAYSQRVEKLESKVNTVYIEIPRISYRDATVVDVSLFATPIPSSWADVGGGKIRLYPSGSGSYPVRLWYITAIPQLQIEQGTVTRVNTAGNYITVDSVGDALTLDALSKTSYVSFIDWNTGKVKGTSQIQSIAGNKITFRTSPTRTIVQGSPIDSALPSDLAADDLLVVASYSCVPPLKEPLAQFIVDHAISDILNIKFKQPNPIAEERKKELEERVSSTWAGRESTLRVKHTSPWFRKRHWNRRR